MDKGHKYDKGVDCAICNKVVFKPNYIRVQLHRPLEESTGKTKVIKSFCLCSVCYTKNMQPFVEKLK